MSKVTIWKTNVNAVAINHWGSFLRFEELENIDKDVKAFILHFPAYFEV